MVPFCLILSAEYFHILIYLIYFTSMTTLSNVLHIFPMGHKLRVLCLHGCRQHSKKFRMKTGGVRKLVKQLADFTFVSAPHLFQGVEEEQRSWWFSKPNYFNSKDVTDDDIGFDESVKFIKKTFKTQGPFDGILGFSQGAAFTALLCLLEEKKELDFKFVIIISGFKSKCTKHLKYYNTKINMPSLHLIGEADGFVDKCVSEELAGLFVNPKVHYHSGGHHVPTGAKIKDCYKDFFKSQI